jgi:hypothetical protein
MSAINDMNIGELDSNKILIQIIVNNFLHKNF